MTSETTVSNETRLPSQVRMRVQRVGEILEARNKPGAPDAEGQPSAAAAPAAPSPNEPPSGTPAKAPDPRESDPGYWKHRFDLSEGLLRAAERRHRDEMQAKDRTIEELRTKVSSLEANAKPSEIDLSVMFTPEQIEQFGEDQCRAMAGAAIKAAQEQAQALIDAHVKPMQERSKAEAQRAKDTKEAAFWADLARLVPNYEQINVDQKWLAWLTEEDEATGFVRQDILDRHSSALNAAGVAKMFKAFEASLPKAAEPPVAPAARSVGAGAPALPAGPAKGYPTREEIRDFYTRSKMGKVKEAERVEFEARLKTRAAA